MADLPSSVAAADILGDFKRTLLRGNITSGTDVEISSGDRVRGENANTGTDLILQGGNSSVISTDGADVLLQAGTPGTGADPGVIRMTNGGGDDTKPVFSFQSQGANGATTHVFVGSRDPEAASISFIGESDLYIREDGRIYQQRVGFWTIVNSGWSQTSSKTANYTANVSDSTIFVDATSGDVTISLPVAAGNSGKQFYISKRDSSVNTVIIDPNGSETINGNADLTINTQYDSVILISDDTEWGIF